MGLMVCCCDPERGGSERMEYGKWNMEKERGRTPKGSLVLLGLTVIGGFISRITDYRFQISDFRLQISEFKIRLVTSAATDSDRPSYLGG
jgi:hypothetical protein